MQVDPHSAAAAIQDRLAAAPGFVCAYWLCVTGDREEYAAALRQALGPAPVAVLVIRDHRFDNANAVLSDLVALMEDSRQLCEVALQKTSEPRKLGLVLLGREELRLSQAASPVIAPEWLDAGVARSVNATIEDITWSSEAPVNTPSAQLPELSAILFDLDGTLLTRLVHSFRVDRQAGNALIAAMETSSQPNLKPIEKYEVLLSEMTAFRGEVRNPEAFRPSIRQASVVGRVWYLAQTTSPEGVHKAAKSLAAALAIPEGPFPVSDSFAAVLRRPSLSGLDDARSRLARNLVASVGAACQFVTAAAHSDSYDKYPLALLRSMSYDLRRSIQELSTVVEGW